MSFRIDSNTISPPGLAGLSSVAPNAGGGFADALAGAIGEVEQSQQSVRTAGTELLSGGKGDVHTVALAAQRAELSLELFQQVRNKFVQAYQEIMKTQI